MVGFGRGWWGAVGWWRAGLWWRRAVVGRWRAVIRWRAQLWSLWAAKGVLDQWVGLSTPQSLQHLTGGGGCMKRAGVWTGVGGGGMLRLVAPARTIGGGAVVLGSAQRHRPPSPWDAGRVRLALALPQGVLSPTSLHTPRTCELSQPAGGRREHFQGRDREREAGLACCCTKPPTPQHSSSWAPSSAASCAGGQEAAGFAQTKGARTRCSTSAPRRAQRRAQSRPAGDPRDGRAAVV